MEVLNVPNLRFPEFTGEWKLHATTDYFEFKNGLNPEAKRFGIGTKFISVMDILNNRYITYNKVIASVLPKDDDLKEFGVNYGDILFQRSSETLEDVGRANVYLDDKTALFGGFVIRGKKIGNYNPLFFRYLLSSPNARKSIIVKGAGAQHFNISQDGLSKVLLNVPSIQEQEKISQFINYIDERIDTQSKIIQQLQSLIKGIVVEHYNKSHKSKAKIKDLGRAYSVMNMSKEDLSETGNECIIYGELFTTYDCVATNIVSRTEKAIQSSTISTGNDLLFPASTTVDAQSLIAPTAISQPNIILGGDMFRIVVDKKYNNEYLSYIFNYVYKNYLARYAQGSTIIHLHYNDIKNLDIELPDINTQKELVLLLQNMQDKILIEKKMLSMLETQKAYLLMNLFI